MANQQFIKLVVALFLLQPEVSESSATCAEGHTKLVDNWRDIQPVGSARTIYRSAAASATCAASCDDTDDQDDSGSEFSATCPVGRALTTTERTLDTTTIQHWTYADQAHWNDYGSLDTSSSSSDRRLSTSYDDDDDDGETIEYSKDVVNECSHDTHVGTYPGESPINFDPATVESSSLPTINLNAGFHRPRKGLIITNDAHTVAVTVCGGNAIDCGATANFGNWPKTLRGLSTDDNEDPDEYYLVDLHFHWGWDTSKGSEHRVCDNPQAAELQMVFANKRHSVSHDRDDADSGTKLVILSTLLAGGRGSANAKYEPLLSAIASQAVMPGDSGRVREFNLTALLPTSFESKFYTYPGSMTTPPCSQVVTWFVFEDVVKLSDDQLELLRDAQTYEVGVELHHNTYKALLFPFFAIFFGTLTLHLLSRYAPFVPYTVMVMLLGMAFDALLDLVYAGNLDPETYGSLKTSTDMWANIDGHVLLYAFLPALLFGDAMTLNIHSFRQCFSQCLLLACPGVFLGTGLTGLAAMYILPYDWDPFFCLCFGSILAATDPVAVVSMLKEVGASQRLTMQITGEALMNDGTAMVLFNLFWAMYNKNKGYLYNDFGSMVKFFCRMSIAGPILGYFLGYISYRWMALATRRHVETDIIVQTSITLFTAYLSFFLGESECFVSGVLCCVTSACVLADKCWPVVNDHHSLENVWHAIEYFGNSVLFFLAGVITHRSITSHEDGGISAEVDFTASDYGYVLLFYMVMTGIRSLMILLFYPLLTRMGGGTNPKDAAFVVWAGLRGAVGLALAQLVLQSGGDQRAGKQLLFVVAGLALLTLIVQGTTCGPLLAKWGMLGIPTVKEAMLEKVYHRVEQNSIEQYEHACLAHDHDAADALEHLTRLHKMDKSKAEEKDESVANETVSESSNGQIFNKPTSDAKNLSTTNSVLHVESNTNDSLHNKVDLDKGLTFVKPAFTNEIRFSDGELSGGGSGASRSHDVDAFTGMHAHADASGFDFSFENLEAQHEALNRENKLPDPEVTCAIRETFYRIVRSEYWEQIESGFVPKTSPAAMLLLNSIDCALDHPDKPLHDFGIIMRELSVSWSAQASKLAETFLASIDVCLPDWVTIDNEVKYHLHFHNLEMCYFACSAFARSHEHAQRTLAEFFGDDPTPDTPEELMICYESAKEVWKSQEVLKQLVNDGVVNIIKTKLVAEHLLEIEHEYVYRLVKQGVLTLKESEHMFESIAEDELALEQARKNQVRELGKREVYAEVHHLESLADDSGAPNLQRLNLARAISEISDSGQLDMVTSPARLIRGNSLSGSVRNNKVAPLDVSRGQNNGASDEKEHLSPVNPLNMTSFDTKDSKVLEESRKENNGQTMDPAVVHTVKAEALDMPITDVEE